MLCLQLLAFRLSQALVKQGFEIKRTKIEALMSSRGVPITDEEAKRLSGENYFEFHAKVKLPPEFDILQLQEIAKAHDAHLSRNPTSRHPGGFTRRFVNMRMYGIGRDTALKRLDACITSLVGSGFVVERVIRECA